MAHYGPVTRDTSRRMRIYANAATAALVVVLHAGLALYLERAGPDAAPATPSAPFEVELFRPPPPLAPPAPEPAVSEGGGARAAPSRVRPSPAPPDTPVEIVAPPEPAPVPDPIVVGQALLADPMPGQGQGGEGTGVGGGVGSGVGPGVGGRFQVLRWPTLDERRRAHPPAALRAGRSGRAELSCLIGLDERLSDCRVLSETPAGQGFGEAALRLATAFRVRPPMVEGRPQTGARGVFGVVFGRDP